MFIILILAVHLVPNVLINTPLPPDGTPHPARGLTAQPSSPKIQSRGQPATCKVQLLRYSCRVWFASLFPCQGDVL